MEYPQCMPSLPPNLVDNLRYLVMDIRESYEAEEHTVPEALSKNRHFRRTNRPKSELTRSIMGGAFQRGAMRLGLNYRDGKGGAVELYEPFSNGFAVIRLKRAKRVGDDFRVSANAATTLNGLADDSLMPEYHFLLGWVLEDHQPLDLFVAEIVGIEEGNPGQYLLGWTHEFALPTPPSATGFQPHSDDDLGEWDQDTTGLDKQG
ncbi:hypothetical protein GCM10027052_19980 [Parafrigoribacterium mesophilum]